VFTGCQVGLVVLFRGKDLPHRVGAVGPLLFDRAYEGFPPGLNLSRLEEVDSLPLSRFQERAVPLYGHWVESLLGVSRSIRTSVLGR
jgi:hypothetical protein